MHTGLNKTRLALSVHTSCQHEQILLIVPKNSSLLSVSAGSQACCHANKHNHLLTSKKNLARSINTLT